MRDLAELMNPELVLPIGGIEFRVSCSAEQGLHITLLLNSGAKLDDDQERAEIMFILGDSYQQMVDAGISWPKIALAGRVAMFHFGISPEAGQRAWNSAGAVLSGNPLPPPPKQLRLGATPRRIFQPRERMDRAILAAARTTR
ncbi:hypothetical protein B2J88_08070 [Rhodococcus sp. SRB_17]|nr:hypothetical protein [Rhodococcus sp. SRB_17]